ncbi:ABC transporter permease [Micromonospora sp. DR5-3]|uniref:sugar ABC transporter permease n=1 Tax=unclassified Micromonospora TaxID=2617518 RepID=UPI0011D7A924|nr:MULTISPECIES: ABC transporter permease [unclassified Micromonospora]MCW3817274.1 ABC transporter permease [Micromonospora sp. DR5-3]TYC26276.1 ABC transporter permease [Micromonospora sp. MP36]
MTTTVVQQEGPAAVTPAPTVGDHVRSYVARVRGGDLGSLPAVIGLVVLCLVFAIVRPVFFSAANFANLFTQGAAVTVIAMGLIFVLLLGEIDLSAGFASGVCAAILANVVTVLGYPWYVAVLAALATGVVIGLTLGFLVAKVGIPSFVVTLAGFLAFQGVVLLLMKEGTNISISDGVIVGIENDRIPPAIGWLLAAVAVLGYAAAQLLRHRNRVTRGLITDPVVVVLARIAGLAVLIGLAVLVLNQERSINPLITSNKGMPVVVPIIGVLLVFWTFVLNRTAYGRHLYAVGGNQEAARRAGINVDRIKISAFVICSAMAAIGGIIAASKDRSVDPNTGGSNVLLYAVGAAVIGGTSLFGGKGRMINAVLGGAVVAVIINGMGLLDLSSGLKYIFTGLVLLLAAGVDALSRRRSAATGTR